LEEVGKPSVPRSTPLRRRRLVKTAKTRRVIKKKEKEKKRNRKRREQALERFGNPSAKKTHPHNEKSHPSRYNTKPAQKETQDKTGTGIAWPLDLSIPSRSLKVRFRHTRRRANQENEA
jgi:hypothetical protein